MGVRPARNSSRACLSGQSQNLLGLTLFEQRREDVRFHRRANDDPLDFLAILGGAKIELVAGLDAFGDNPKIQVVSEGDQSGSGAH